MKVIRTNEFWSAGEDLQAFEALPECPACGAARPEDPEDPDAKWNCHECGQGTFIAECPDCAGLRGHHTRANCETMLVRSAMLGVEVVRYGAQKDFVNNTSRASAYIGGLGSGKTFAGIARGLKFSQQPMARG